MGPKVSFAIGICALLVSLPLAVSADDRVERLSEEHRTWLERDVVLIITDREREVFLTLGTEEERNRLIDAFWRKRDPDLATPTNEFKDEHYRRLEHANGVLGRDSFREGWQTDRGRYYIILGEPLEIQRNEGYGETVPTELWFYQSEPVQGLPAFFYLLFFKRGDVGEYRLYDPVIDGPQALLTGTRYSASSDALAAVNALRNVSEELARASLSFDTSQPPDFISGQPTLGTAMMMARIEDSPKRMIRTDYADAWMRYGNRVSAEYSFNYVPSRSVFSVLVEPGGTAIVQYSIELDPQNFTLGTDEDETSYYTTLDIATEARTSDGLLLVANDKELFLELSPSQVQQARAFPFAFQDNFPLVPGDFTVTVILRNRVAQQYTVAERELHVPDFSREAPTLSDLVLAFDSNGVAGEFRQGEIRTYQIGDLRLEPAAENIFVIGDSVHLVTQAYGASPDHEVLFELAGADGQVLVVLKSSIAPDGTVLDHLRLNDLVGGTYALKARLVSPDGQILSSRETSVTVSPRSVAARPSFVYRRGVNTNMPGLLSAMLGDQLWSAGRFEEARTALEKAVAENPRLPKAQWMLANAYLREERPDEALKLLAPLEEEFGKQYEVVAGLGYSFYLKDDFEKAASYFARAIQLRPPDTILLNVLGDSYQKLGKIEEARQTFERSLALDPEQLFVKERLASLETTSGGP